MNSEKCEFEIFLLNESEEYKKKSEFLDKEKLKITVDNLINFLINEKIDKKDNKRSLGNLIHLSIDQSINYSVLSISKGHLVLSKFAGRKLGERIIEKSGKKSLFEAIDFLKELFLNLKIGIMDVKFNPNEISLSIKESVFSAGVENIEMKLCAFLSGIIQGSLIQGTEGIKWIVKERTCVANGDEKCEFICTTENPEALPKILLG